MPAIISGKANGVSKELITSMTLGSHAQTLENHCRANITHLYLNIKQNYEARKASAFTIDDDNFPEFPEDWVGKSPALLTAFIKDYFVEKPALMAELKSIVLENSLAVDHQRKVVKTAKKLPDLCSGSQSFTVVGDLGLIHNYVVVPDTGAIWIDKCMLEIGERHGANLPPTCYVDVNCCNGKRREENYIYCEAGEHRSFFIDAGRKCNKCSMLFWNKCYGCFCTSFIYH